jgi:hypothetical protein
LNKILQHFEIWSTQLAVYDDNETAWNYPGVVGLHGNGTLIVVSGNTAAVLDPDTGNIINQVDLPQEDPALGSYNSFATTSDGILFAKALFRTCDAIGSTELANCLDTEETQTLLALDPALSALQILLWFMRRWQVEVTFHEVRTHWEWKPSGSGRIGHYPHHTGLVGPVFADHFAGAPICSRQEIAHPADGLVCQAHTHFFGCTGDRTTTDLASATFFDILSTGRYPKNLATMIFAKRLAG